MMCFSLRVVLLALLLCCPLRVTAGHAQAPFSPTTTSRFNGDQWNAMNLDHSTVQGSQNTRIESQGKDNWELPLEDIEIFPLFRSGDPSNRVDLVFFGDGYLGEDGEKLRSDAQALADDIIFGPSNPTGNPSNVTQGTSGAFGVIKPMLNIWAVHSGIGDHDTPRNTPFGLYRPGPELRGIYYAHPSRVKKLCAYLNRTGGLALRGLREIGRGDGGESLRMGCDEPILLGNDPLYGGLGGTPTVITASKVNGPMVLRHELGHTLIPVGEEYEGGTVYSGVNANHPSALEGGNVSWAHWLTDKPAKGKKLRLEDMKVPLQVYPWHDLSTAAYRISFNSSVGDYPRAMIRFSISSIPHASHLALAIGTTPIPFELYPKSIGSKDRAWVEIHLSSGLEGLTSEKGGREHVLDVALTECGRTEPEGQGGKMITSIEIIEYGPEARFDSSEGFVGAYPTFAENGSVTVRPTNEYCLMRNVRRTTFCPPCREGLTLALLKRVSLIDSAQIVCEAGKTILRLNLLDFPEAKYSVRLSKLTSSIREEAGIGIESLQDVRGGERALSMTMISTSGWYGIDVALLFPGIVRLEGRSEMKAQEEVYFFGC